MPFAIPVVWREPADHSSIVTFVQQTLQGVKYPDLPSAVRPAPRSKEVPVPKPSGTLTLTKITDSKKGPVLIAILHLKDDVHHLKPTY